MAKNSNTIRLIFGFKVKYLRQQKGLSYQQLSTLTGLSLSYIHDIEKGKKYPKTDKIMALAEALEVDYDYMVSLRASKKLQPIIDILHSDLLKDYPLEVFGLSPSKLLELFSNIPEKINAFISTILTITRSYQMTREHFYQAALRSYQDMHDNYFEDIERVVKLFKEENQVGKVYAFRPKALEKLLKDNYEITVDRDYLNKNPKLQKVRSYYKKKKKILYLNSNLSNAQETFLLGRELGFQYLNLKERSCETRIINVKSFDKLLNNFKASYFSAALLMDEQLLIADFKQIAQLSTWQEDAFLELLDKYNITAEMLVQRLTNILPKHFGIKNLFFLRISGSSDLQQFNMTKELHLAQQQHHPYSNERKEHYCQRWIAINIIKRLRAMPNSGQQIIADAQVSKYWGTRNAYLCLTLAKRSNQNPTENISVTIGLLVNSTLKQTVKFLDDPNLKQKDVNITCERCDMPNCGARVAPPVMVEAQQEQDAVQEALADLEQEK
ncbi:MAG: helix-turn-helix domain-containing protein [Aureispira sp.]|nr:helix-turn-helix domain-containing protein [Aureispira sp.]